MEILKETFFDSIKILPLLFVIYVLIEFIELKYAHKIKEKVESAGNTGPAIGAVAGAIPQCGFSVIASSLYVRRFITIGTLLAVYLSTSDEAIPILLSQPKQASLVLPVIGLKIVIAIIAGYLIDAFARAKVTPQHTQHDASCEVIEHGCCDHDYQETKITAKKLLYHPLVHTIKIFAYIFIISLIIALSFEYIGQETFKQFFLDNKLFQPFIAGLIGLIPNCAASVAITQFYIEGIISFGAMIAGLCASAGLGILVLFKENRDRVNTLKIIGLLFLISIITGFIIQSF